MQHSQAKYLVVKTIPQALDPDELSLVDASLGDLRVPAWKYFEQSLVVAVFRYAW